MNLSTIKSQFQLVDDNLGIAISNLNDYQNYINLQLIENILVSLAIWYENNVPTENVNYTFDIPMASLIGNEYIVRIHTVFNSAGKVFNLFCTGGVL